MRLQNLRAVLCALGSGHLGLGYPRLASQGLVGLREAQRIYKEPTNMFENLQNI